MSGREARGRTVLLPPFSPQPRRPLIVFSRSAQDQLAGRGLAQSARAPPSHYIRDDTSSLNGGSALTYYAAQVRSPAGWSVVVDRFPPHMLAGPMKDAHTDFKGRSNFESFRAEPLAQAWRSPWFGLGCRFQTSFYKTAVRPFLNKLRYTHWRV
jgi:hypothetical protein